MKPGITEPQYRVLAMLDDTEHGERRFALARNRRPARNLERIEAVEHVGEFFWRITDHGHNVRENYRQRFEPAMPTGDGEQQ